MNPVSDAFTAHFFKRLAPDVRDTLTPRQRDAITDALRRSGPRDHAVDLRWTMNLLFTRIYVVLLAGRDLRRKQSEAAERTRTDIHKVVSSLCLLVAFLIPVLISLTLLLYGLKCLVGINLFEDKHFMDFLL